MAVSETAFFLDFGCVLANVYLLTYRCVGKVLTSARFRLESTVHFKDWLSRLVRQAR